MANLENDIDRFIIAQDNRYNGYEQALNEIRDGKKVRHWIWYIFPQLRGLGYSRKSYYYGIKDKEEAWRYITNPMLRDRMFEITEALLEHSDRTIVDILGHIDSMKVQSSMTLFNCVVPNSIFARVLQTFYNGEKDRQSIV